MPPASPATLSIVQVTWRDAFFEHEEPSERRTDYVVRTVGFLLEQTTGFITVAAEQLPDGDGWRALTHVPMSSVLAVVVISGP
jgi:hypothetical protein